MSHVDEGALHAYLDGALDALPGPEAERIRAHLAACGACALRLEEERAVRAEAQAILAGASPALGDLPSLEELRALADARRAPSAAGRLRQLGFAASLVLAVGAGWMLRGSQAPRFEGGPLDGGRVPAATDAAPAAREEALEEAVVQESVEEPAAPARDPSGAGASAVTTPTAQPEPTVPTPAVVEAEAPVAPEALGNRAVAADAAAPAGTGALQDSLRFRLQVSPTSVEAKAAEAPAAAFQALPMRRADARPSDSLRGSREAASRQAAGSAFAPAEPRPREELGLGVPGLPYLSVAWAPEGLPEGSVRVLQRVGSDTLEVLHIPADAGISVPWPSVFGPRNQAVVLRGDVWLLGRAVLPREEIEALLARIPPEER